MHTDHFICIVDDDDVLREGLVAFFRSAGIRALAFASAEAMLEACELPTPDCLVTDLQMAGMSGLMLAQELLEQGRPLPTVLVTAYLSQQVREAASSIGIAVVLEKPVDPELLLSEIGKLLAR